MNSRLGRIAGHGRSVAAALLLAAALIGTAWGQEGEALPDGREIVDRFVEAIGGKDAILEQGAQQLIGRIEVPSQGIAGDLEAFSAPPNKLRTNIELPGIGAIKAGYDGEVGWTVHPAFGPMLLEGRMLDQMRHQADTRAALHPETLIASLETVEKVDFDGQPCYKVKVVTRWDEEYFEYYNVESGLLVGGERTQATPMGDIPTTSAVGDYRDFGGLLLPTRTVQRTMGIEQVITVSEVKGMDLGDEVFAPPAEIKALMEPAG